MVAMLEKNFLSNLLCKLDSKKKNLLLDQIFQSNSLKSNSIKDVCLGIYFVCYSILFRKEFTVPSGINIYFFELSDDQIENRTKFLEYHLKQPTFGFTLNRGKSVFEYRNLFKRLKMALSFFSLMLRAFFFKSYINPKLYGKTFQIISSIEGIILMHKPEKIYFFHTYYLPVSICSLYLSNILPIYSISGNTPLSKWSPYKVYDHLVLCNQYQLEEVEYLRKQKQIKFNGCTFYGNENQEVYEKYSNWVKEYFTPKYDIGIYTMGFWARAGGVSRIEKFNLIKSHPDYNNNEYYFHEKEMINQIKEISEELNLKIIIYPHPYERQILENTNLNSYYADLEELSNFEIDNEGKSSNLKFEDSKIGITTYSTVGFDRLNFNFKSIFYVKKNELDLFDASVPSKWGENFVQNRDQLKKRIISLL